MGHQLPLRLKLDQRARLDNFVGDTTDRVKDMEAFVFVSGPTGSGKSHLLQGMCHEVIEAGKAAIYLCELEDHEASILDGLESFELVCLDAIDTVIGQPAWQNALFHLVNSVRDSGGRLVLSASCSAAHLDIALNDLASRIKGAYLVNLDVLDDEGKLQVVRQKAESRGFKMPDEVCRFILARSERDMHHLSRLVEQLDEETLRRQKKVTIPFVKEALGL